MDLRAKQGLILGAIAGAALGVFLFAETGNPWVFLLIPVAAVMGMAPQFLRPPEEE